MNKKDIKIKDLENRIDELEEKNKPIEIPFLNIWEIFLLIVFLGWLPSIIILISIFVWIDLSLFKEIILGLSIGVFGGVIMSLLLALFLRKVEELP